MPETNAIIRQLLNMGCSDFAAKRLAIGIAHVVYHYKQEIGLPLRIHAGIEIIEDTEIVRSMWEFKINP